jgi:hypothetical protein
MYHHFSKLFAIVFVGVATLCHLPVAQADVCVTIDTNRDNLTQQERTAIVGVIIEALEKEGAIVDSSGKRCHEFVVAYSIRLGERVTGTVTGAGEKRTGEASSTDELDLLYRQLVRALVLRAPFATGGGVQQRDTVLRDQTAPRRLDASDGRYWDTVVAVGGGVLQLPPNKGEPLQRQNNIVVLEGRAWGFITQRLTGIEFMSRIVIHDYSLYQEKFYPLPKDTLQQERKRNNRLAFGWLAVPSYDAGFGLVHDFGHKGLRPYIRGGATISLLLRASDESAFVDVGIGGYAGLGLQLTDNIGLSVTASVSNPVAHNFGETGYSYFGTGTATLEFRAKRNKPMSGLLRQNSNSVPVIRRINE